ncbi:Pentatricopeptide repeat [Dillenia turbinata]|uniref:Pentatricopeptide repeat n=1 Tax=Dillenia turbinata TaxID=194707 RepID=A0AAN8VWV8_9MAGN
MTDCPSTSEFSSLTNSIRNFLYGIRRFWLSTSFNSPQLLHSHHLKHFHVLHSCKDPRTLTWVHSPFIVSSGFIASKLISSYAQFGDLDSALSVSHELKETNSDMWNAIIKSHVDLGFFDLALLHYKKMRNAGVAHDRFKFPSLNIAVLVYCVQIRMRVQMEPNSVTLIIMLQGYSTSVRNAVLKTHSNSSCVEGSEFFFNEMAQRDGELIPNIETLTLVISAFSKSRDPILGEGDIVMLSKLDTILQSAFLDLYANCGELEASFQLFREISYRNSITWNP